MEKEKYTNIINSAEASIVENKIVSFDKINNLETSYRVHQDGFVGIHYQVGKIEDEEGYKKAEINLKLKRPYPFELEKGVRSCDKSEKPFDDKQILGAAKKVLNYLHKKYPDYTFGGKVNSFFWEERMENSCGMDFQCKDANSSINLFFKHKNSKDINDGGIFYTSRNLKLKPFYKIVDNYLENFTKTVEMPEDCLIIDKYYGYTGLLRECLSLEKIKNGTSLLSGKIGQQVFSEDLTVYNDVSDKNRWMTCFWDGDGVVPKGDKVFFIKNGKIIRGYCGKKVAKMYNVKTTGNEGINYCDIPSGSHNSMSLKIGKKFAKELLNGRLAIIPVQASGGGFKEKGDYTMPVQIGLLTDGEKILGRVPPFTIVSNLFDMFGKDFIGIAKYNKEIFNDKVMIFRCQKGNL